MPVGTFELERGGLRGPAFVAATATGAVAVCRAVLPLVVLGERCGAGSHAGFAFRSGTSGCHEWAS